ncbi:hydrogenase 4 subunit B [Roseomonas sp. OT10]|uniref:proton-conducting transporter transmembrane domain-containing protein n=1 Tax=Roseomonas cutis TaxID=2897332 RepID=UPI001E51BA82|nr:proton-conducting transporter membrane subunit [Roseomonas sp. OT10]UFN49460.1 hydrogenase 4 subunit B [Roseomonas sp. OT10]
MPTLLALVIAALVLLAPLGAWRGGLPAARLVLAGCALGGAALAGLGVAALLLPAAAPLPIAPAFPLAGMDGAAGPLLAPDALSGWFLLLLGLAALAACLWALSHAPAESPRRLVPLPLFLAGMALALGAGDGLTLLLGFEAMSLASWVLVAADHQRAENRAAARLYLAFALFSGACLLAALALLAIPAGALSFAALREAPPDGWRAVAILLLVTAGAGAKAGLVPLHAWLPLAHPAAPSHVSALMSGAMTKVALYVLARLLLDLCGPAQPAWWGVPLVALGVGSALLGALRANLEGDVKTLLACSTIENVGLIATGLGLAAMFRGADLAPLAALAAGAALLHALFHALFKTLLFLVAGEVAHAAGSRALDRLGGLIHPMPLAGCCALLGAAAAAALPPLSGFASEWLLLQALIGGWRLGQVGMQVVLAGALAVVALSAALAAAAMVRFVGLAFLGRPRHPRTAGAADAHGPAAAALAGLAALAAGLGLLPGPLLGLATPALHRLTGSGMEERVGPWSVAAGDGTGVYWPLAAALLLAMAAALLAWAVRLRGAPEPVVAPAWDCGFQAPPPHLPFGDPATQPSAEGLSQPLRRMLSTSLLSARERVEPAAPGSPQPARLLAGFADPSLRHLLEPLARLRDTLAARAERLRDLSARQCLGMAFAGLLVLLALVTWLGGRA